MDDLHRVDTEAFGDIAYKVPTLRQLIEVSGECCIVAEDSGGVLGYAIALISPSRDKSWLLSLGVLPEAKGRGAGRRLTESIIDILRALTVPSVWLTVDPDNAPAVSLYRSLGFLEKERYDDYFGPGENRILMELVL